MMQSKGMPDNEEQRVEFQTVLRIRPLLKRERDDPILLDARSVDDTKVRLLPMPIKHNDILSPSSALIKQTLSPAKVQERQALNFQLDHVWPADANQDKVYFSLGLPLALAAIEPLKFDPKKFVVRPTNHLIVGMGVAGSGKTFSCWGSQAIHAKRKHDGDGLLPRIVDSLYSQSKVYLSSTKSTTFAVNISVIQVNQDKKKPDECELHDLLQSLPPRAISLMSPVSTLSLLSSGSKSTVDSAKMGRISSSSTYNNNGEPVFVEQDVSTASFHVVNGEVRTCPNVEQARETLQMAVKSHSRLSNKNRQSHIYVTLQPVLLDRSNKVVREGGTLAVLDMAGYDDGTNAPKRPMRDRDVHLNRDDGHAAVLHCLRTLQRNDEIKYGTPQPEEHDDNSSVTSGDKQRRCASVKKVPYRQHKLTMLMQPLFATAKHTSVTLLVTAYPGHRDYAEKKALLNELKSFCRNATSKELATTGLKSHAVRKKEKDQRHNKREKKKVRHPMAASDADDECSEDQYCRASKQPSVKHYKNAPIALAPGGSHMYDDSTASDDDEPIVAMPPPVAPSYASSIRSSLTSRVMSPEASAPMEERFVPVIPRLPHLSVATGAGDYPLAASTNSFELDDMCPPSPPSPEIPMVEAQIVQIEEEDFAPLQSSSAANIQGDSSYGMNVFNSSLKTFNKVVSASKKNCKHVVGKMSHRGANDNSDAMSFLEERMKNLQARNDELEEVNWALKNENTSLKDENEELRALQNIAATPKSLDPSNTSHFSPYQSTMTSPDTMCENSSCNVAGNPRMRKMESHESRTESHDDPSPQQPPRDSPPRLGKNSIAANPLFMHIAQMRKAEAGSF
jgi:hypothetical protein